MKTKQRERDVDVSVCGLLSGQDAEVIRDRFSVCRQWITPHIQTLQR